MAKVKLNSVYVEDHPRPTLDCGVCLVTGEELPSMCRQEFAKECDINVIMKQYEKLGVVSHVNVVPPRYGDFTDIPDFTEAQNMFVAATEAFMKLPARLRADYDNDPAKFIAAIDEGPPELLDRLRSLGLLEVPEPPPPAAVDEPPPPAAAPPKGP